MEITKETIVTVKCDHCDAAINNGTAFLSIGDHRLAFHLPCFTGLTPGELLHHMGHDESVIHTMGADGTIEEEGLRLRDPRALRQDGTIDRMRSTEVVDWPL